MERDNNNYNELYNKFILMYNLLLNNIMVFRNNAIDNLIHRFNNVVNQFQQFNNNPINTLEAPYSEHSDCSSFDIPTLTPETLLSEHSDCSNFDNPTLTPEIPFEEHPDSPSVILETPLREYSGYGGYVSPVNTLVSTLDTPETPLREYPNYGGYVSTVNTLVSTFDTPETLLREYSNYGGHVSPVNTLVSTFDTPETDYGGYVSSIVSSPLAIPEILNIPETPLREYSDYNGYISPVSTLLPSFSETFENPNYSGSVNPVDAFELPHNEYSGINRNTSSNSFVNSGDTELPPFREYFKDYL